MCSNIHFKLKVLLIKTSNYLKLNLSINSLSEPLLNEKKKLKKVWDFPEIKGFPWEKKQLQLAVLTKGAKQENKSRTNQDKSINAYRRPGPGTKWLNPHNLSEFKWSVSSRVPLTAAFNWTNLLSWNSARERALTIHHPSDVINCTTQLSCPPPLRLHLLTDISSCDLLCERHTAKPDIQLSDTFISANKNKCEQKTFESHNCTLCFTQCLLAVTQIPHCSGIPWRLQFYRLKLPIFKLLWDIYSQKKSQVKCLFVFISQKNKYLKSSGCVNAENQ